ncbi:MAG: NADH:ubiquinone oxidoreductase subunit NDUFA12 [Pacificimonas sp.]
MGIFKSMFTWWDGPTIGTRLWSKRHGEEVGRDDQGNVYMKKPAKAGQRERRWVIFAGENEASRVPPEWHGWLHRTLPDPPTPEMRARPWIRDHRANPTGTALAYVRPGTLTTGSDRPTTTGDYESWSPDEDAAT